MQEIKKSGKCVIFSAPSGAGKTTIVHRLLSELDNLEFSISACSRDKRGEEVEAKDYYFLGVEGFKSKIEQEAFVEWEEVYKDNFYGTLKSEIDRIWNNDNAVIFDVDVIGGLNLKKQFKENALSIFVQPPSLEILEERLRGRKTESEEKIQMRLAKANEELSLNEEFDVIILNDDLEKACNEALEVVTKFLEG